MHGRLGIIPKLIVYTVLIHLNARKVRNVDFWFRPNAWLLARVNDLRMLKKLQTLFLYLPWPGPNRI